AAGFPFRLRARHRRRRVVPVDRRGPAAAGTAGTREVDVRTAVRVVEPARLGRNCASGHPGLGPDRVTREADMERVDVMLEPLRAFLAQLGAFMPRLLLAAAVLVAGWLIAKAVRFAVIKALRAVNFHVVTERAGIDAFLVQGGLREGSIGLFGTL